VRHERAEGDANVLLVLVLVSALPLVIAPPRPLGTDQASDAFSESPEWHVHPR
jgi:hypothetical protein